MSCRLLSSPTQPKVIQKAEMQYGCCVRCRCVCVHVWRCTVGVLAYCIRPGVGATFFLSTTETFEVIFLSCENPFCICH